LELCETEEELVELSDEEPELTLLLEELDKDELDEDELELLLELDELDEEDELLEGSGSHFSVR